MSDPQPQDEQDDVLAALRGLQLAQAPQRDLWPDIEPRLRRRRSMGEWLGYAAAAGFAGIMAAGVWLQQPVNEAVPVVVPPTTRVAGIVAPQQKALLKANLAIVKDAENQLRYALASDPQSPSLQRLLASVQQQRSELKQQIQQAI